MFSDDNDNILPFTDYEFSTDIHPDVSNSRKIQHKNKIKKRNKSIKIKSNITDPISRHISYIYFDNTTNENNFLSFIPYTGPSNTLHLSRCLYLPQLISNTANDSTVSSQRFIQDYNQTITSMTSSLETMSLSVYIRFGILYVARIDPMLDKIISLKDFVDLRNRGKKIKTSFYTCKGVTSPKNLLTTITQFNYRQISSNTYSYEIQLYGMKNHQYSLLHFQYNEQLQCTAVFYRPDFPTNFDFIRNKTSSLFRSIDDSYSDIFDFRIQLSRGKCLDKTDSNVLDILRGVPIDQVLYIDTTTQVLHVSSKLQKFVKYMKCTRSSNYQNFDEQILISIGTYEEFELNSKGQCELLMKASNMMVIEFLDLKNIPSANKLYEIGMWFSTLCQTCVELPTTIINKKKTSRWFSDILRKKSNQSIKQINVNQLTTYKTQKSRQTYTSEELTFVKKILQEENLRNILLNSNEEKDYDRNDIEQRYENITKRLKTSAAPSVNEALQKVERAYQTICKEFVQS